jgi:hypothetical protein
MLPYVELHAESLVLLFGYGLLGFLALALALTARELACGRRPDPGQPNAKFRDGIEEGHGPVPLFLVLLYVALAVWAVLYVLAHAWWGMDFGG